MNTLPDANVLLDLMLIEIQSRIAKIQVPFALVGIESGGALILQRLLPQLPSNLTFGTLDVSFYRDDYHARGLKQNNRPSRIPFAVDDVHLILIDDVFYTGRTTRAAINAIFDYGRPASIHLLVMVWRQGQELPIVPHFAAQHISLGASQTLALRSDNQGVLAFGLEGSQQ